MSARSIPILLLTEARHRLLSERLRSAVGAWAKTWGNEALTQNLQCTFRPPGESPIKLGTEADVSIKVIDGNGEQLLLTASQGIFTALLGLPRHCAISPGARSILAPTLYEEMLRSLAQFCMAQGGDAQWTMEVVHRGSSRDSAVSPKNRTWGVSIGWDAHPERIDVELSPTFICRLAPIQRRSDAPVIQKRRSAIGEEKIKVRAVLGETVVSVGDLTSLAVDDVLVLADELAQPNHLATDSGQRVASVSLGCTGNKRAVVIVK